MVKFDIILCYSQDDDNDNDIGFAPMEASSKSIQIFLYGFIKPLPSITNWLIFHYKIRNFFFF